MRKCPKVLASLLLLGCSLPAISQDYNATLNQWATGYPQEKIFIHYDKEAYVPGESVWFKAYLYNNSVPSGLSNNFYLQLIDPKGRVLLSRKYPVMGAVAKGNFNMPDSISAGEYYLRAFTPGMLNYGDALLYKKKLLVFKPPLNALKTGETSVNNIDLQFFPESGNLVESLKSVVAFRAVDQWGAPVEVNGTLRTSDGADITGFKSYHDGIGTFEFLPLKGRKYVAELELNGANKAFPLPDSRISGINLKVQDEAGGKLFQLARSETGKQDFETLFIVVEMNNAIIYENEIAFEGYPSVQGHLLTDSLPSGILHFTIFNKAGAPIAERLSFVDNGEYKASASLDITKTGTGPKAENIYEINFSGGDERSCSVSITDASSIDGLSNENIYSGLLLTGDLHEPVFNPAWYFMANDSSKKALDNLMLTEKWARFDWAKLLNKEFPDLKFKDEQMLNISGYVNNVQDKERVKGGRLGIDLMGEDSIVQNLYADIDQDGQFTLRNISVNGHAKFGYAYTDGQGKQATVKVHFHESDLDKAISHLTFNPGKLRNQSGFVSATGNDDLKRRYQSVQEEAGKVKELQKVVVRSKSSSRKPIEVVNENYTTGAFRTMGKVNIDNISNPPNDRSMNGVDFVKNRIQQIEVQGNSFVNRKNFSLNSGTKWNVQVMINESPSDLSMLRTIRADEIALVKFYEAGFVGVGSGSPGGAVAVYTKKQTQEATIFDKVDFVYYDGYSLAKEFAGPDYKDGNKESQDKRSTLYWNPDIYTGNDSKSFKLNFYNNDFTKKFRVVVEGFDASGKLIHLEKIIGN